MALAVLTKIQLREKSRNRLGGLVRVGRDLVLVLAHSGFDNFHSARPQHVSEIYWKRSFKAS